ncbi:hypothetical protein BDL97_14G073800 [Sphagnum fallax]|nr:hypothetical protein BDL97_14G073800 [Sphagnum fallax]
MGPVKRKSDAGALRGKRRAENEKTFSTGEGRQQEDSSSSLSLLAAVVAAIRERTILLLPSSSSSSSSSSAQCCFSFSVIFAHTNILTTVS